MYILKYKNQVEKIISNESYREVVKNFVEDNQITYGNIHIKYEEDKGWKKFSDGTMMFLNNTYTFSIDKGELKQGGTIVPFTQEATYIIKEAMEG